MIACNPIARKKEIQMNWTEFDLDLPAGIVIYEGFNKSMPLKAWAARVDYPKIVFQPAYCHPLIQTEKKHLFVFLKIQVPESS